MPQEAKQLHDPLAWPDWSCRCRSQRTWRFASSGVGVDIIARPTYFAIISDYSRTTKDAHIQLWLPATSCHGLRNKPLDSRVQVLQDMCRPFVVGDQWLP